MCNNHSLKDRHYGDFFILCSQYSKLFNEKGLKIPFHRIVYANGTIWTSEEHRTKRLALYKKEGITIEKGNKIKDFNDIVFDF